MAADDVQGAAGALMAKRPGVQKLFVLRDAEAYGVEIAATVRDTARSYPSESPALRADYRDRSLKRLANRISSSGADGVFLGGILTASGPTLVGDLRAVLGRRVQLLAPDGFSDFKQLTQDGARRPRASS